MGYVEDYIEEVIGRNIRFRFRGWKYRTDEINGIREAEGHELPEKTAEAFKVKYRGGYPTKKSINELIKLYDPKMWRLHISSTSKYTEKLIWSCNRVEEKILEFIDWATVNYGIQFGEMNSYKSPYVGSVKILKKEQ